MPRVSVRPHPTPYNGTNFNLTGVVRLDVHVDTVVTAMGVWSPGDDSQESTLSPYPTDLTFEPLATNSSGEYTLTVTVSPSDNSQFILSSNGNTSYNLVVERELTNVRLLHLYLSSCHFEQLFLPALPPSPWHPVVLPRMMAVGRQ